jgi:6-phosphofructokinase 1
MTRAPVNLTVLQGGGPTPVLNASLFAVIDEALHQPSIDRILGARFGVEGLLKGDFLDLSAIPQTELQKLRTTPGASLGTTRHKLSDSDLDRVLATLKSHNIRHLLLIGGNGSLRAADLIAQAAVRANYDLHVIGVPKTIDNDIPATDRCPGYASAARYVAQSVRDLGMDVRCLPQPVSIFETMGRSVGWLAAASVLGRIDEAHAPHLVYLPERPLDIDSFLADIDRTVTRRGWAVAVLTEGARDATGRPVYETMEPSQLDPLNRPVPGGVSSFLANTVTQRLKLRCRWEKPGICGRNSILHVSPQDRADAELVGRAAVRAAVQGHLAHFVSLRPIDAEPAYDIIPLSQTTGERPFPADWTAPSPQSPVTDNFLNYVRPLIGDLVDYAVPLKDQFAIASLLK